ncbi:MAG: dockerin type I repeat-containing protein [Prevotella sp.]|nr:dockerin type I repeat-containing protein [Prevotella sp.]
MKKILGILILFVAFAGKALAWDPVIKETHWFGQYEYQEYNGPFVTTQINFSGDYVESIIIAKEWAGPYVTQHPKTSFYSWIDHQLRFSVSNANTSTWSLDRPNNNSKYNGFGLKNISGSDQQFTIHNLNSEDTYSVQYYAENGSDVTNITGSASGTATVTIPNNAVIRCVVITVANYQKAESDVRALEPSELQEYLGDSYNQTSFGYKYYYTKSGVLEDKRGAVPYITMKFGADNDMTFVRALGEESSSSGSSYQFLGTFHQLDNNKFIVLAKNRGGDIVTPEIKYTDTGNYYYTVTNTQQNDAGVAWDCQFWIGHPDLLNVPAGAKVRLHIRGHALDHALNNDNNNSAVLQAQGPEPIQYISFIDNVDFSTGWWTVIEKEVTVSELMAGNFQYFTFNLNTDNQNNTIYFCDFQISVEDYTYTQGGGSQESEAFTYGAASIIDASNNLDPATDNYDYLQYRWTYKQTNNLDSKFTNEEIRDRLVGKEWSTFTAKHDYTVDAGSQGTRNDAGEEIVYGDKFLTIFPLCGNFFYFYPEVNGKLIVEYYCEGVDETPAFWFKTDADGNQMTGDDQYKANCQHFDASGNSIGRTNGSNNYYLTADVQSNCVYYLCSLPTNMSHERPILRVKSYSFIPSFRVDPLYKVIDNVTAKNNDSNELKYAAEIFGGPYNGTADPTDNLNTTDLNNYQRTEDPEPGLYIRNAMPEFRVKCLGNVASAKAKVFEENGKQYLGFYDITFKTGVNPETGDAYNPGGAVVAHINNKGGQASFVLTIAYDAAEAKMEDGVRVAETRGIGKEVKRWDFFTDGNWDLGKYGTDDGTRYATNANGWKAKSKLFREIHKADGETQDWNQTYVTIKEGGVGIEPIFKSVYDMEGDNADMIHETAGLVFFTHANHVGVWNENGASSKTSFQDRFVGFMDDGQLVIPLLKAGDRIVIKMGCYGNVPGDETQTKQTKLRITGAYDALGEKEITEPYYIGGSGAEVGNGTDMRLQTLDDMSQPWGEYHFVAKGGDVTIELEEGELLKIYSIAIYRNDKDGTENLATEDQVILTENKVMGDDDKRYILNLQENTEDDYALLYLNHRGLIEPTNYHVETRMTGNFEIDPENDKNDVHISSGHTTNDAWYNYSVSKANNSANAKFGIFKTRMGVKTIDGKYVTDYAECMVPVGYRQLMEYPYTWDFTDLRSANYVSGGIDNGVEKDVDYDDLKIWDEWNFRSVPEKYDGYLFAPGGQLYGGTTMFDETRGIGVIHNGENGAMSMTTPGAEQPAGSDGGFAVSSGNTFEFVVPKVPADAAVYVHARKVENASTSTVQRKLKKISDENPSSAASFTFTGTDENGDDVFALKCSELEDVHVCVQGYEVNKIAVATDAKSVNKKGYASESRDHAIDASLLPYFTGKPFRTYTVTGFNKDALTVELNDVSVTNTYVVPANTGVVIFNDDTKVPTANDPDAGDLQTQFGPFDGGFHLFVPDMHDKTGKDASLTGNLMVAALEGCNPVPYTNGDEDPNKNTTNYVLSYKYKKLNGNNLTETQEGPERFYRVYSGNTVKLKANSAYMQLPTAQVAPGGNVNAPTRISFRHNNFMLGDVNRDREVDVADFTGIANHILGRTPEIFIEGAADVNRDDDIDVADITSVANIILGVNANGTNRAQMVTDGDEQSDMLYVEPFTAIPGTQQDIAVRMTNYTPATGYEFTLTLPEGMTFATDADGVMARLSTARTSERKTNFFATALQADGSLKVLCGTSAGDGYGLFTFDGTDGEVAIITVNIPANSEQAMYTATVSDGKYSDIYGLSHAFGTMTGISDIAVTFDAEPDTYYTLSGQKLNGRPSQRGFYILNGKKVMVK